MGGAASQEVDRGKGVAGFNDARDNEQRGAKHKTRCESTLQALEIASMASRWSDQTGAAPPLIELRA